MMPKVFHSRFFYKRKSCQDLPSDKGDGFCRVPMTANVSTQMSYQGPLGWRLYDSRPEQR